MVFLETTRPKKKIFFLKLTNENKKVKYPCWEGDKASSEKTSVH